MYLCLNKIKIMLPIVSFLGVPSIGSWVIIALALLLLFGGKKIPELMKGLGSGMKEFKKARAQLSL